MKDRTLELFGPTMVETTLPKIGVIDGANAFLRLRQNNFLGGSQAIVVREAMRGEEAQYFREKMVELDKLIATMPVNYEQDGLGDQAIAYLHYFAGSCANWWITERDKGAPEMAQSQAFGLADLFGDGGELGYISIPEILAAGGELDFHFAPCSLREVRAKRHTSTHGAFDRRWVPLE
ncbi:MAG: hypothetical protein C5B50_00995 [Verrucomicrobia bacterium]|nr:MAG: hypothetical protein C5B50_00995 [Verrucomicrobiota bacterium]